MTTQIAVRLPAELVAYLDAVGARDGRSRAAVVTEALRLHRQRLLGERDAQILRTTGDYDDLADLVAHGVADAG